MSFFTNLEATKNNRLSKFSKDKFNCFSEVLEYELNSKRTKGKNS